MRWRHPQEGVLSPMRFLPVIEGSDLEVPFGYWVIQAGFEIVQSWLAKGFRMPLSINVSARHLQSKGFLKTVEGWLCERPTFPRELLEAEITESGALMDLTEVGAVVRGLRKLGIAVSLDDFGTGYSSLKYLRHLPVSTLKIDQTFVRGMLDDPGDLAIVQGVVSLAASFRTTVVAEGVETIEQGVRLLELGVHFAQGYAIAAPLPQEQFVEWTATWRAPLDWGSVKVSATGRDSCDSEAR